MRNIYYLVLITLICGCTAGSQQAVRRTPVMAGTPSLSLTSVGDIRPGMSIEEVNAVMGQAVEVGFRQNADGVLEPITIPNPYRIEMITADDKPYKVAYYLTDIHFSDRQVSEDELTPLVFDGDELLGRGQGFLADFKNRMEIQDL